MRRKFYTKGTKRILKMSADCKDLKRLESAVAKGDLDSIEELTRNEFENSTTLYNILKNAISSKQIEVAQLLINRGCSLPENKLSEENGILHFAIAVGALELVHLLIEKKVSTNFVDEDGMPPLFKVVHLSSRDVDYNQFLDCLLPNKGTIINNKYQDRSFNVLHYAAEVGNADIIPILIERGIHLHVKSSDRSTALHVAAKNRHSEVVKVLLKHGLKDSVVNNDKKTPLHYAIENGDVETFQILLNHIFSSNQNISSIKRCLQKKVNQSLVYLATSVGNDEMVKLLLLKGVTLNYVSKETEQSAFHLAVENDDIAIVDLLFEYKAKLTLVDKNGCNSFHVACMMGNLQIISMFLETDKRLLSTKSKEGLTGLHLAAKEGYAEVVSLLLEMGAECVEFDEKNKTPLSYALENNSGDADTLTVLLKHIRQIENNENKTSLLLPEDNLLIKYYTELRKDLNENSILHLAVEKEDEIAVHLLLKHQACINKLNKDGLTPLDLATVNGSLSIVNLFLQSNLDPRTLFTLNGEKGFTPMHYAVQEGNADILEAFFKAGISVDLNFENETSDETSKFFGLTPLHIAVQKNDKNLTLLLLKNGAKVDVPGKTDFETPLFVAAEFGNKEVLEILSEASSTRSLKWKEGYLPLCIAAYRGHEEIVKMLLDKGVDPNANIGKYLTPLHAAAQQGHENIIQILLERGAKVNPKQIIYDEETQFFSTPLLAASYAKHNNIVELLLNNGADFNAQLQSIREKHTFVSMTEKILTQGNYKDSEIEEKGSLIGYKTLHFAVKYGDERIVNSLINFGANVNVTTKNGSTGLGLTIERGEESILNLLLSAGADVLNKHNEKSILGIEALKTNVKISEIIVQQVASSQNKTVLKIAVENELEMYVKKLLEDGNKVHVKDENKLLLHVAVRKRNITICKLLLEHGIDINVYEETGKTALMLAVDCNEPEIVNLLLDAGAYTKIPNLSTDYNYFRSEISEPLIAAILNKNDTIIEMFLKRGLSDSDCKDNSPFRLALRESSPQIVQKFIQYGVSTDIKDEKGECPIFYAIKGENLEVVDFLLKTGASIHATTNKGEPILHFAMGISSTHAKMFQTLVNYGVDVNGLDTGNRSPLNLILNQKCPYSYWDLDRKGILIHILLANGANPDQVDTRSGKTMLDLAVDSKAIEYLKLLILYGADVNFLNVKNKTSLKIAIDLALQRSSRYMYKYGRYLNNSDELDNLKYDTDLIRCSELSPRFYRVLPFRETVRLLVQEIARREAANEVVDEENRLLVCTPYVTDYYERCRKEIDTMKVNEICHEITYFHILVAKTNGLASYARYPQVKRILLSESSVRKLFPEYGEILVSRIMIGKDRRNLLDYRLLKELCHFNFPLLVAEHIFSFLTLKDLRCLHTAKEMC